MEQNNNPLIEQFQKKFASLGNTANRESWNSIPMMVFRTAAVAGWTDISLQINSIEGVLFKDAGTKLCAFAIDIMTNDVDSDLKISEITLDLGVDCLKSLTEIKMNVQNYVSLEQKEIEKQIVKGFLDYWKEWLKKTLEQEGRLV